MVHSLGFGPNIIAQMKKGASPIPLSRVMMLAEALRLSPAERFEFVTTRLIELHDDSTELCFTTVVARAQEAFAPAGADATLVALWKAAAARRHTWSPTSSRTPRWPLKSPKSWSALRSVDSASWRPKPRASRRAAGGQAYWACRRQLLSLTAASRARRRRGVAARIHRRR